MMSAPPFTRLPDGTGGARSSAQLAKLPPCDAMSETNPFGTGNASSAHSGQAAISAEPARSKPSARRAWLAKTSFAAPPRPSVSARACARSSAGSEPGTPRSRCQASGSSGCGCGAGGQRSAFRPAIHSASNTSPEASSSPRMRMRTGDASGWNKVLAASARNAASASSCLSVGVTLAKVPKVASSRDHASHACHSPLPNG